MTSRLCVLAAILIVWAVLRRWLTRKQRAAASSEDVSPSRFSKVTRFLTAVCFVIAAAVLVIGDHWPELLPASVRSRTATSPSEEPVDQKPIPAVIRFMGHIEGVDVWLNGVHVGTSPIHTTVEELLEIVPDSRPRTDKVHDLWLESSENPIEVFPGTRRFVPLFEYANLPHPDPRRGGDWCVLWGDHDGATAYFRSEGIFLGRDGGHRSSNGDVDPFQLLLDVTFRDWEDQVDQLVDKARLANYEVDDDWLAAMASYRHRGWRRLRSLVKYEPEFAGILDAWARWHYDLDKVTDSRGAWQVVERVFREADKQRGYDTDTPAGRAIRVVVPYLDPGHVVDEAKETLASVEPDFLSTMFCSTVDGEAHYLTLPRTEWRPLRGPVDASFAVLSDVVFQLDKHLDEQPGEHGNLVEVQLVPFILNQKGVNWDRLYRQGHSRENAGYLFAPVMLGGSKLDEHLLAKDWKASPRDLDARDKVRFDTSELSPLVEENRWLLEVARLDSATGRRVRSTFQKRLFELADEICLSGTFSPIESPSLEFLFQPAADGTPPGVEYWNRLSDRHFAYRDLSKVAAWQRKSIDLKRQVTAERFQFVKRLGTHATDEMIHDLIELECGSDSPRFDILYMLESFPDERRIRLLTQLVDRLRTLRGSSDSTATYHETMLAAIDHEDAAKRAWACFQRRFHERKSEIINGILDQQTLKIDRAFRRRLSPAFLRVAIQNGDADVRRTLAEHFSHDLLPERVVLLNELAADADETVAAAAAESLRKIEEVRERELPSTGLEPVPFW